MEFDKIDHDLFIQLHKAIANVMYHQAVAGDWERWALVASILSAFLVLSGLLLSAWPWPERLSRALSGRNAQIAENERRIVQRKELVISFAIAMAGMLINFLPFASWSSKHVALTAEWTTLRNDIERLTARLHSLGDKSKVPNHISEELAAIKQSENVLISREVGKPDKKLFDKCWEDTNEVLYGKGIRTKAQAEEEYERRKLQGKRPIRPDMPEQARLEVPEPR